jgi:hypothetical protein
MPLYERYELLELRRDDGIQTFHARETATARPVQIHMFPAGDSPENSALLSRLDHLPDAEWRRVIERGDYQGRPYVVTDRLAGYPGFREWLTLKTNPASRNTALDHQFHQLFDPDAETAALTVSPSASPLSRISSTNAPLAGPSISPITAATPPADSENSSGIGDALPLTPSRKLAKSLLGIMLGIVAAIVLLALIVAGIAFRPR